MGDMKKVGRVGGKALIYFELVTTLAIVIGLLVANIFQPGKGFDLSLVNIDGSKIKTYQDSANNINWGDFLSHIITKNIFESFAKGDILKI